MLPCLCVAWMMCSCVGTAPSREVALVDSLNLAAYTCRYKNLDASHEAAVRAYEAADMYHTGKAEACNNLGFCAFMRMDFAGAERHHREVYARTKNELELLIADIGLMKIYQRIAMNKEFYDYRNSAVVRMKRIREDSDLFVDRHERMRLNYARTEFHIVSAIYHYYLRQPEGGAANLNEIPLNDELKADTNQLLYYHYIKGVVDEADGETRDERRLHNFDNLYTTWRMASQTENVYFEGNGMQGLANLLMESDNLTFFRQRRPNALQRMDMPQDSLLPMRLATSALQKFRQYDDVYQTVGAYASIGKYLNMHGQYEAALDTLQTALTCADGHTHNLQTVPEWVLRIHEQLSVAYSGLGMKQQSDYHRNIYLDILEETRQDKEWESRYHALSKEIGQLNISLIILFVLFAGIFLFFWFFNKRSKRQSALQLSRLHLLLGICQKITASVSVDAGAEEEISDTILKSIRTDLEELFGGKPFAIADGKLQVEAPLNKDERAIVRLINPYIQWALDNGHFSLSLNDERNRLEKQRYVYEQRIARNKQQNVVKKACLSIVNGIQPYIDRIINETGKLTSKGYMNDEAIKAEKYLYIDELVTRINEYNEILALWIKMKQGSLNLNVETFALNELFDLLRKGGRAFEMKQQTLQVEATDACVKADKALTLFMINTLAENARKYTPAGGLVKVYARRAEDYVEVSVEDNGYGLSPEDVARIVGEKVYDSKSIGMDNAFLAHDELLKRKGCGFGLMNCKGIIEKYRKTNEVFSVCKFDVESEPGKGSRFYFRLPTGVVRLLTVLLVCLGLHACRGGNPQPAAELATENLPAVTQDEFETLLDSASNYANAAYYSNVDGAYLQTLQYIDSAMMCLNAHQKKYFSLSDKQLSLNGESEPAEWTWWKRNIDTDYHIILDIRNEAAIAFLALKRWEEYTYNNTAYTSLYKLLGEDRTLEDYCLRLERSLGNKVVSIVLFGLFFLILLAGYYLLYFRKRLVERWKLEQVFEVNKRVFAASGSAEGESEEASRQDALAQVPRHVAEASYDAINELVGISGMVIALHSDSSRGLEYVSAPNAGAVDVEASLRNLINESYNTCSYAADDEGRQAFPLMVEEAGGSRCIGVLCLIRRQGVEKSMDRLLLELVARYIAVVLFNSVSKLNVKYRDIETAQDEARRASWEESTLHVQNQVLDNCLSSIKHETIYYPNRIKQLITKLRAGGISTEEENDTVAAIKELIEYYKGIFTILASCASRQLEGVTFRRTTVRVADLMAAACKYMAKMNRRHRGLLTLSVPDDNETDNLQVTGDYDLLYFLLENLIDEAFTCPQAGTLQLRVVKEDAYIRFLLTDRRRNRTQDELNRLFYPNRSGMAMGQQGELQGTEYLICKQIIRDHDEFTGHRGCRINAQVEEGGGFTVYFTLPRPRTKFE